MASTLSRRLRGCLEVIVRRLVPWLLLQRAVALVRRQQARSPPRLRLPSYRCARADGAGAREVFVSWRGQQWKLMPL
eukprot:1824385-Pyramimonas_sp.AAC.1